MRILRIWIRFSRCRNVRYRVPVVAELCVSVTFFCHAHWFVRPYSDSIPFWSVSDISCFWMYFFLLYRLPWYLEPRLLPLLQYRLCHFLLNFLNLIKCSFWRHPLFWLKILMNHLMCIRNKVIFSLFWPLALIHWIQFLIFLVAQFEWVKYSELLFVANLHDFTLEGVSFGTCRWVEDYSTHGCTRGGGVSYREFKFSFLCWFKVFWLEFWRFVL